MRPGFRTLISFTLWLLPLVQTSAASQLPAGILKIDPPRPAPALQLADDSGKRYDLQTSRGHWVFVHFWASWCGPCKREMPSIQQLKEIFTDPGLQIILINTAETDDTIFSFLGATAPALTTLMDTDGQVTEIWAPRGLPTTYLVDPGGKIRYMALGGRAWDTVEYQHFLQSLITKK